MSLFYCIQVYAVCQPHCIQLNKPFIYWAHTITILTSSCCHSRLLSSFSATLKNVLNCGHDGSRVDDPIRHGLLQLKHVVCLAQWRGNRRPNHVDAGVL